MDQGEPGKDLPILEQTREADPHETESSKKMEAATEPTPDTLTATTEMVNAPFEVTAPVALQEQFSPFEDVSPPPPLSCPRWFSSLPISIVVFHLSMWWFFLEKEVCGD